jgi:hypothetical protein
MSKRMRIAILLFSMVQIVVLGTGILLVLATPLANRAMDVWPWVWAIGLSLLISPPIAWLLAPLAEARHARDLNAREPSRSFDV